MSLVSYSLKQAYKRVEGLGDRLDAVKDEVDWEGFRPILDKLYQESTPVGGRPHTDTVLLFKMMVLQSWYSVSDEELEYQCSDRLSFQSFLGFPETVPDYTTVWKFRERLAKTGLGKKVWSELQQQLDQKNYKVKKGVIQDASIIKAYVGRKRYYKEKQAEKKGETIEYTPRQRSHIDKDGSFTIKNNQVSYGYKLHQKMDVDHGFIREQDVTTAKDHDNQIDLVENKDHKAYRDKGYFGSALKANEVKDKTMRRATKNNPLNRRDKCYNRTISKIRSPGERPFAVLKSVFKGGHTRLTTLARVAIQQLFACIGYNIYHLHTVVTKNN